VHDIAREEGLTAAYIYTLLRLPWLAPDITTAIVNGRQPQQLNAMTLMRRASRLPLDWRAAQARDLSVKRAFEEVAAGWLVLAEQTERMDSKEGSPPQRKNNR